LKTLASKRRRQVVGEVDGPTGLPAQVCSDFGLGARRGRGLTRQSILFVKGYPYRVKSEDPQDDGSFLRRDAQRQRGGVGDSLRVKLMPWLYLKASYEYAAR
jgi:hypothetical protein